jgi:hypothetical protein
MRPQPERGIWGLGLEKTILLDYSFDYPVHIFVIFHVFVTLWLLEVGF